MQHPAGEDAGREMSMRKVAQAYARVERPGSSSSRRDEGLIEAPPYAVFTGAASCRS